MSAKNPRINTALDKPTYEAIKRIAKKSISFKARDLVQEALELREDAILKDFASEREKTFKKEKSLSHELVWKE